VVFGRKLSLGVEAYYRSLNFQSVNDLYDETRAGIKLSLTRALWSDFFIGSVSYTIENVGIDLDDSTNAVAQIPPTLAKSDGDSLLSRLGISLAYDTRNNTTLPDAGQRTEIFAEIVGGPMGGDEEFYKLELKSAWYFRPYFKGMFLKSLRAREWRGESTAVMFHFTSAGILADSIPCVALIIATSVLAMRIQTARRDFTMNPLAATHTGLFSRIQRPHFSIGNRRRSSLCRLL